MSYNMFNMFFKTYTFVMYLDLYHIHILHGSQWLLYMIAGVSVKWLWRILVKLYQTTDGPSWIFSLLGVTRGQGVCILILFIGIFISLEPSIFSMRKEPRPSAWGALLELDAGTNNEELNHYRVVFSGYGGCLFLELCFASEYVLHMSKR